MKNNYEILGGLGIIAVLVIMILPLPTWMLSILLVINIAVSVTVLLITTYIKNALEFSVFPSLLLAITLFRLSLNVSSTKLILLNADAGSVVEAFGQVVVKGNPIVGFIVFSILILIQFIVITKGAERVSEVGARFTLDAMPGKQMGVDADLNAGIINEQEAKNRREGIEREADFYGAMDGASKFVRGDAIASIIIVAINILAGVSIGFLQRDMNWVDILRTYTLLTIGDGLVNQIPALIISTATGIIVTRSASKSALGNELVEQISDSPKALTLSGMCLLVFGVLGMFTGLPSIPFLVIAGIFLGMSYAMSKSGLKIEKEDKAEEETKSASKGPEDVTSLLPVEALELELGYGLLFLVDQEKGSDLLDRIAMVRRQCAKDLGIVVPPVRIRDNNLLSNNQYSIKIKGMEMASGELLPRHLLAIHGAEEKAPIKGIKTKEPTFGLPATWIREEIRHEVEARGHTVVDNSSIVVTHLTEIIKSHSYELLGRQEVQALIDGVKGRGFSTIVEELVPQLLSIGSIQKVLQNLLRERIPIRDLVSILECLGDHSPVTKDVEVLTEYVRNALSRQICKQFKGSDGVIHCLSLSPQLEKKLFESIQRSERGGRLMLDPETSQALLDALSKKIQTADLMGQSPVILCSPTIRPYFRRFIELTFPQAGVLSYSEVTADTKVESIGVIEIGEQPAFQAA